MGGSASNFFEFATLILTPDSQLSEIVTESMRCVSVGGTPDELPSSLIFSTTLIPEVTCPNST
jgi:hypothetical protein